MKLAKIGRPAKYRFPKPGHWMKIPVPDLPPSPMDGYLPMMRYAWAARNDGQRYGLKYSIDTKRGIISCERKP